jgi:hypothetical protein
MSYGTINILLRRQKGKHYKKAMLVVYILAFAKGLNGEVTDPISIDNFPSARMVIEIYDGGPFYEQKRMILADNEFLLEIRQPTDSNSGRSSFELKHRVTAKLKSSDAARIWAAIGRLHIERWLEEYPSKDSADGFYDAPEWSVDIRMMSVTRSSKGEGAYPSDTDPKKTVRINGDPNAFQRLEDIFSAIDIAGK